MSTSSRPLAVAEFRQVSSDVRVPNEDEMPSLTCTHVLQHPDGGVLRGTEHGGGEALAAVVHELQRLPLPLDPHHAQQRPEALLVHDCHGVRDFGKHHGAQEVALGGEVWREGAKAE